MTQTQVLTIVYSNINLLFSNHPGSKINYANTHYISPSAITKWCSGNMKSFDITHLYDLSKFFGVPVTWFFQRHEPAKAYATEQA